MCGITGIYHFNKKAGQGTEKLVADMTQSMAHRGPDAHGVYSAGHASLGHRRLSIIDLDPRSNQPFTDVSGRYTLVFNGQIYNFKEIKATLSDYPFSTTSDTEVIIAAYAQWKEKCLDRMNGMFALAIYDAADNTLFLARDRLGVKPLYYTISDDTLAFASEMRALLTSGMATREISRTGLLEYLMYQAPVCPNTILADVKQLKPGHYAYIRNGTYTETRYWTFGASFSGEITDERSALKQVRDLMFRSVERRLVSDVPLGAFLSGGIDSSLIVAAMAQVSSDVNTFSITFDERDYDESPYSQLIADRYRTNHHPLLLKAANLLEELPNALDAMDSPSVDGVNSYVISKVTKQAGITVALSGLGGDELFAGYHYFRQWQKLRQYGFFAIPVAFRKLLLKLMRRKLGTSQIERLHKLAQSDGTIAQTYPAFRQVLGDEVALRLTKLHAEDIHNTLSAQIADTNPGQFPHLSRLSIAELCGYTRNVLLKDTDQFSMASALEVREPYFDYELVDYVMHVPDKWKLGNTPKRLLTTAMSDLLPGEIVNRPKRGFLLPWEYWLKHELADFAKTQIDQLADRPEFDGDQVRRTWDAFQSGNAGITWPQVWQLIALSHWLQRNAIGH